MNNISLSQLVSISDLQRNYNELIEKVKKLSKPIILLRRNKPEAVLVSVDCYEKLLAENKKYEESVALMVIENFSKEKKNGTLRIGKTAGDLINEN